MSWIIFCIWMVLHNGVRSELSGDMLPQLYYNVLPNVLRGSDDKATMSCVFRDVSSKIHAVNWDLDSMFAAQLADSMVDNNRAKGHLRRLKNEEINVNIRRVNMDYLYPQIQRSKAYKVRVDPHSTVKCELRTADGGQYVQKMTYRQFNEVFKDKLFEGILETVRDIWGEVAKRVSNTFRTSLRRDDWAEGYRPHMPWVEYGPGIYKTEILDTNAVEQFRYNVEKLKALKERNLARKEKNDD